MRKLLLTLLVLTLLTGCGDMLDPYKSRIEKINLGDTRERVIEIMGPVGSGGPLPTGVQSNSTEGAVETMIWRSMVGSGVYTITLENGVVVDKKGR